MEDSEAVVLRCSTLWWQHLGVDGLFSGHDKLLKALIYHGAKVVTLLSFQNDGHDLLVSVNDLVFRQLHTYGHFCLFTEYIIRFYKFQSSCFCDHK